MKTLTTQGILTTEGAAPVSLTPGVNAKKFSQKAFTYFYYGNFGQQVTMIDLYFFLMFNLRCNQSDIAVIVIICVNHTAAELL